MGTEILMSACVFFLMEDVPFSQHEVIKERQVSPFYKWVPKMP